jgi:molecular chaperone HscB
MAWREALDDSADDRAAVAALDDDVRRDEARRLAAVAALLDGGGRSSPTALAGDVASAASQVRALMFVRRFQEELARRLDALESAP